MRPESASPTLFLKSLPALALAFAYLILFVRPWRQEVVQLTDKQTTQAAAVAALESRRGELEHEYIAFRNRADFLQSADELPGGKEVSQPMGRPTAAETFSLLLAAFEEHGVSCTRSDPTVVEAPAARSTMAYTLHLIGSFSNMCQALKHIHETVPSASPASLTMSRHPEAECKWEIAWDLESENQ